MACCALSQLQMTSPDGGCGEYWTRRVAGATSLFAFSQVLLGCSFRRFASDVRVAPCGLGHEFSASHPHTFRKLHRAVTTTPKIYIATITHETKCRTVNSRLL